MRKISIFIASVMLSCIVSGQNLIQNQTLQNYQQLNISKPIINTQIDFEQLSQDLENLATKTPDGQIKCFSVEYNEMLRTKYPNIQNDIDFESWIAPKIQEYNNNVLNGTQQKVVVTIPIIMHIIYNSTEAIGTGRNISQAQATSQITILNNDFRKLNADTSLIPVPFKPLAADLEINFVPALRYASNHALAGTTLAQPGIDRISAPTIPGVANTTTGYSTAFIDATIKPNTYWNRTEVMNVWVCQISGGILGYAQFPTGSTLTGIPGGATGANTDGLVLNYTATGTGGVAAAPYNKGRTATHEIGHWFGLRHIWGDETACTADDFVTDTPQQQDKNFGCPAYPQTTQAGGRCSTGDPSSMYMNYMDYTDDACMFMFTQGQKARVVTVLANSPGRVELPTSLLGSPLVITAQFVGSPLSIPIGNSVTFTDQSTSPNTITTWNWTFTGGTPSSFSGKTPPAITYSAAGNYNVSLTVIDNLAGTNTLTKNAYINVYGTTAAFVGIPLSILAGSTVNFTDQSLSNNTITTWNWTFTGGTPASFSGKTPPAITYNTPGSYNVSLTVIDNLAGTNTLTKNAYVNVAVAPPCDTLNFPPPGTVVAYTTGAGLGYVIGSNQYLDIAKAEFVSSVSHAPYTVVTGGYIGVRSARSGTGSTATVDFKIWAADGPAGAPGTVLATKIVPLSILNTNTTGYENNIQKVMFDAPLNVGTADYYFGFVMTNFKSTGAAAGKDTLGVFSNTSGDSSPGTAWEQQSDNIWYDVDAAWGGLPITSYLSPIMAKNSPTATITTSTTSICIGGSIDFNASTSLNALTYNWTFNNGSPTTSTTTAQTVTYAAAGAPKAYLTATGDCGAASRDSVAITVNPNNTASAASSTPTVCINTAITNITHTTTGATAIGAATGLPAGVTANWVGGTITISGTPTASGTFNYSIPLSGGCGTVNATGTITVTPSKTVTAASSTPTLCINTVLTSITHTTTLATGIGAATGLPAGVTANWVGGTITISGTPTASGTFNYNIPLSGGCGTVNAIGTIIVIPLKTVTAASSTPTVCINTAITNITHTTTGATSIGAATGLPAGVTANWVGGSITISGTPTASGTFNYSIPLSGGCGTVNATGTITVTPNKTVTAASSTPTVCVNTAITNITHTTTLATGIGAATGLPAGVTSNWVGGTITISGTPTASGTFNYTIPLSGGCGTVNATGTITVTPNKTVTAASSTPTVCINTAITNITHTTTLATGIGAATGLPAGVTANWVGGTITISGTPTASGTFNYSIPLSGGCGTVNATGTIIVTTVSSVTAASSTPTVCVNTAITNITHTTTLATGIGAATGLPAGVTANWAGGTITISGTPTASGTFNYSIPLSGGCGTVNATGTITVTPNKTVTAASSTPTVCVNTAITNITHTTTLATGIGAATGLPAGVTSNWVGGTITISGTPTASGTFNYSIPLSGGCGTVNATGTITVTPLKTVTAASSTPTVCINTAITNITHTTTLATGIGVATGLPAGVTANWVGGTITIGGTPTASGTFNYSIPLSGGCGTVNAIGSIAVNALTLPTFTAVSAICSGAALAALPTTSTNGVTGTWSPALDNMNTTTYTFTPTAGQCATSTTMSITVNSTTVTPTFAAVSAVCSGSAIAALPTTSTNGVTGTWSPAIDNTATTTYTFTPTAGQCATSTSMSITVTPNVTPTFAAVSAVCSGSAIAALPTTSTNGVTGTWSPAIDNTATTTYTFTPTAGQCATTTTMSITVTPNVTPTFAAVSAVCSGSAIAALPTTSTNGVTGTWSPAINNTATTTYTFTPTAGQCATTTTMSITVTPNVTPTFAAVSAVCSGSAIAALPTTSTNGVTGTWSPAINNTATTTYTFTPTAGQCATSTTMSITVTPNVTPTFAAVSAVCSGSAIAALPTTSTNGVTGTWSPVINNTATTTYTFTPTAGQCATTTTMSITVTPNVTPTFASVSAVCSGSAIAALPTTSTNGVTGTWSPAINNTATTTYTFTPTAGQCATSTTMSITVTPNVTPTFASVSAICSGAALAALPTTSTNGVTGTWSPAIDNTATTTYTFTPTAGQCASTTTLMITVNPSDVASISYSNTTFCVTENDAPSIITGLSGGTFSSTPLGLTLDGSSGLIGVSTSSSNTYTVTYTTTGPCPATPTATVIIDLCLGVQVSVKDYIKVFPNPASTYLTIDNSTIEINQIRLINILGEAVVIKKTTSNKTNIGVEQLPMGIYFIQLYNLSGQIIYTQKISIK